MTKFQLMLALFARGSDNATITINGSTGILQSITRESGSGNSFVVVLSTAIGKTVSEYVKTVD